MGLVKHLVEMQEKARPRIEGTRLLYENDYINDSRCKGIERQIIAQGTFGLSSK